MTKPTTDLPAADEREHVEALAASVVHWQDEADQLRAATDRADADAGRRILDGEADAQQLAAERAEMAARLHTAEAARDEAARRLTNARRATLLTIADDLDRLADKAATKLADHEAKLRPLLDQLAGLDGRGYRALTDHEEAARIDRERGGTGQVAGVPFTASVSKQLDREAARLSGAAERIRGRATDGLTAEQYADALAFADRKLTDVGLIDADQLAAAAD